jgi:hypothetical protein
MVITTDDFKDPETLATDELAEALLNDDDPDADAGFFDEPNGDVEPEAGRHARED